VSRKVRKEGGLGGERELREGGEGM